MKWLLAIRHFDKDGEDLSDEGKKRAHAFGKRLKSKGWVFDRAFGSGIPRSDKTVEIILEELGLCDLEIKKEHRLYFPDPDWGKWNECKEHPEFEDKLGTFLRLWPDFIRREGEALLRVIKDILEVGLSAGQFALCVGHSPFLPAAAHLLTQKVEETDFGEGFLFMLKGDEIECSKIE